MTMDDNQLQTIAKLANARIDELFAGGQVRSIPQITVGMVRIVLDVAQEMERQAQPVDCAARAERPARPATARKSEFVGIRMSEDEFDTVMAVAAAAGEPGNISAGVRAVIDGAALALLGDGATPVQEHDDSPQQTTDAERDDTGTPAGTDAASPLVPAPRLEKRIYSPERIARATEARMAKRAARLAAESPTPADNPEPAPDSAALVPSAADRRRQMLGDIIAELRSISDDGLMPDETAWNRLRPISLPDARTIRLQWDITWQRLAQYAKLAMPTRKRPGGRTDAADMVRTNAHNGAVES